MENTFEQPKNNDLIYINGELFHENKSKVDGTHITRTHVLTNSVIILSNKVDMLDKGTNKIEQKNKRSQKKLLLFFQECVNEVKLLGKIGNEIQEGNFTAFSVVTHNNSTK